MPVENDRVTYRGGKQKSTLSQQLRSGKFHWLIGRGLFCPGDALSSSTEQSNEDERPKLAPSVRDWCNSYAAHEARYKRFTVRKYVHGLDAQLFQREIAKTARALGYEHRVEVRFEMNGCKVDVGTDTHLRRLVWGYDSRDWKRRWWGCVLLRPLACPLAVAGKRLLSKLTTRWDVVEIAYTFSRVDAATGQKTYPRATEVQILRNLEDDITRVFEDTSSSSDGDGDRRPRPRGRSFSDTQMESTMHTRSAMATEAGARPGRERAHSDGPLIEMRGFGVPRRESANPPRPPCLDPDLRRDRDTARNQYGHVVSAGGVAGIGGTTGS